MTSKALFVVKEREHDANTTAISQLLLDNVISDPGMIFLNGIQQELLLVIRLVIGVAGFFSGRANLAQL
jgi:hypothetical protein